MISYSSITNLGLTITIFLSISINSFALHKEIQTIKNLNIQDEKVRSLRKDIRRSIYIIKSRKDQGLMPDLKFYKYRVDKKDSFWKIIAKTSQDIDTLYTVNDLSCPDDIFNKKLIFIPNMRGVIHKVKKRETIQDIARQYKIEKDYIYKANNLTALNKKYLFIPCARISNLERSLFLGVGFASPIMNGYRTSNFGTRIDPFNKEFQFHSGVDIACPIGTKVYAARNGKVIFTGYKGGYGLLVIIKHEHNYSSYYGHLSRILIKTGSSIKRGDVIAYSGNSGRTTGPHLHFEVRKNTVPKNPGILIK